MIRTIVIDDEPLASGIVQEYLADFPQFDILEVCRDGFEGLKAIQTHRPDLIFLDIQMPKISGFEMLELLDSPPSVIFTTAFDTFAIRAFDAMALDYLLKPFSKMRFKQAIEKFLNHPARISTVSNYHIRHIDEQIERLVVRVKNEIKIIHISEVICFEAEDDYVCIHTRDGKFLKKITMKVLEESTDSKVFVRVHRSFLVSIDQIIKIEPFEKDTYFLTLRKGNQIPVSKTGYTRLRRVLGI